MASPRVANRYAKSLLLLAEERGALECLENDIQLIEQTVSDSKDLNLMLASPIIKGDQKQRVLNAIFSGKIGDEAMAFLQMVVKKGRERQLRAMVSSCADMIRKRKNIQSAEVITAVPMDNETRAQVTEALSRLHDGTVELKETQDPRIIGGFVLRVEDRMIDASVRRQLQTVRRRLTENDYEPEL